MRIISYDCAFKSLGVAIIDIDFNKCYKEINNLLNECIRFIDFKKLKDLNLNILLEIAIKIKDLKESILNIIYNNPKLLYTNVFDLIPGQSIQETKELRYERLQGCLKFTKNVAESGCKDIAAVLVEYQMNINDKSREVMNQIKAFYSSSNYNFLQGSTFFSKKFNRRLDNLKLYRNGENNIRFEIIKPTLKNKVSFSKVLTYSYISSNSNTVSSYKCNKLHCKLNFLYFLEKNSIMKYIDGVKKSNIDDIADAFMQAFAWYLHFKN